MRLLKVCNQLLTIKKYIDNVITGGDFKSHPFFIGLVPASPQRKKGIKFCVYRNVVPTNPVEVLLHQQKRTLIRNAMCVPNCTTYHFHWNIYFSEYAKADNIHPSTARSGTLILMLML